MVQNHFQDPVKPPRSSSAVPVQMSHTVVEEDISFTFFFVTAKSVTLSVPLFYFFLPS